MLDAVVERHLAVLGKTASGKTYDALPCPADAALPRAQGSRFVAVDELARALAKKPTAIPHRRGPVAAGRV